MFLLFACRLSLEHITAKNIRLQLLLLSYRKRSIRLLDNSEGEVNERYSKKYSLLFLLFLYFQNGLPFYRFENGPLVLFIVVS